jgi:hypothetical protein
MRFVFAHQFNITGQACTACRGRVPRETHLILNSKDYLLAHYDQNFRSNLILCRKFQFR